MKNYVILNWSVESITFRRFLILIFYFVITSVFTSCGRNNVTSIKKQSLACVAEITRYCLVIADIENLITLYFHQSIMSVCFDTIFYANLLFISLYIKNVNKFVSFFFLEHLDAHEKPLLMSNVIISFHLYKKIKIKRIISINVHY